MSKLAELFRTLAWKVLCSRPFYFVRPIIGLEFGHFRGKFATPQAALDSVPASLRSTFDNEELVPHGIKAFSAIHHFDWPVLFQLQRLLGQGQLHTVTDFGGHIGVKFYAFRDVLSFPADFNWQVVDVPVMIAEGRRRLSAGTSSLTFHERLEDTGACDVLLCSGVLPYVDISIEELVGRLPAKPRVILLNKVAVSRRQGFYTVENFIKCLAYQVLGPTDLSEARQRLGYTLTASWPIPDRDVVLTPKGFERVNLIGEAWTLLPPNTNDVRLPHIPAH